MPSRYVATLMRVAVCAWLLGLAWPAHAQPGSGSATTPESRLNAAIAQLTAEAGQLTGTSPQPAPRFVRPHPALRNWGPEMGPVVLQRLGDRFADDAHRNVYVRWHLSWALQQMMQRNFEQYQQTGKLDLPNNLGRQLIGLLRDVPGNVFLPYRLETTYNPPEIAQEYQRLINSTTVRIGFPPFERIVRGRAALPHMSDAERTRAEAALARAEQLRGRFTEHVDQSAKLFNDRVDQVNMMIREYRGDLIYALIQAGDPALLRDVVRELENQVKARQIASMDLMRYAYLAAFDGYLTLYEPSVLRGIAADMLRIARQAESYEEYRFGDFLPNWYRPRERNFADYAFHMIKLLEDPGMLQQFHQQVKVDPLISTAARRRTFTAQDLTVADIEHARQRAIRELYNPSAQNERVNPHYRLAGDLISVLRGGNAQRRQELLHDAGNQAVVAWALLEGGENYQDPRLLKRVNWVLSLDPPYTYDRGMRLQMLAQMPFRRWEPWVHRDLVWLSNAMTDKGSFPYQHTGGPSTGWGDHANGQYGVLGIAAAQKVGYPIPQSAWQDIDTHWRLTQQQTPGDNAAGWALGMLNVNDAVSQQRGNTARGQVSGPMTAAGVYTLNLTERALYGTERTDPTTQNVSINLRKGLRWLDENFSMRTGEDVVDWYYYMWTIQQVGQATGYRTFNGVDWFRDITAEMLNRQRPDGLWEDPSGRQGLLMSTGFALLYLSKAHAPLAVSKIRYEGNWNSRPHDLWNFVEFASDEYQQPTAWQIVNLDQPVFQLIESPILYLSTTQAFDFSDAHIKRLREYIDAGGLLVINPDAADGGSARSINILAGKLFPNNPLEEVGQDHMLYNVHRQLRPVVKMRAVTNHIRPLMIVFQRDIGQGLQANDVGRSDSFIALSNLYLYTIGMQPRRQRLDTHHIPAPTRAPANARTVRAAQLSYRGSFNPEPAAMGQLQNLLASKHNLNLNVETIEPSQLSSSHSIAFLTTTGEGSLTDEQAQAIRTWVEAGGTLWIDAAGGARPAVQKAGEMLQQIHPQARPTPLGSLSPIVSGQGIRGGYDNRRVTYRQFALRQMGPVFSPRVQAVRVDERPAILFSPEDITAGLAGVSHWGIFGYTPDAARQLVVNSILQTAQ